MRLFRMFFGLAFGLMIFFFLAKFALIALFIAAICTMISFAARKMMSYSLYSYRSDHPAKLWRSEVEPLFYDQPESHPVWHDSYRSIEIQ
ncbi:MAG: hypothetical protein HKN87_18570 [Saprospiraceae bacterium]|nr:hypothetical protein [Saprospiraceae bacterium]